MLWSLLPLHCQIFGDQLTLKLLFPTATLCQLFRKREFAFATTKKEDSLLESPTNKIVLML